MQLVRAFGEERLFNVHYWRDTTKEVDIVIDKKINVLPIEVKYRNSITTKDLKGLKAFVEKFNPNCSVVIY